uniref:Uncharacterized protein n=1 Tax=Rhizophora mucronata TaxID=61149 RepID=A0A2P2K0T9_RHIMU
MVCSFLLLLQGHKEKMLVYQNARELLLQSLHGMHRSSLISLF